MIYYGADAGTPWYLRLIPFNNVGKELNKRFPHGIPLGAQFANEVDCEAYRKVIIEYLKKGFKIPFS